MIFSSAAASDGPSPAIVTRLTREVAPRQRHVARWDTERTGDQPDERAFASPSLGAARTLLEHALSVGALLDAVDGVAPPLGVSRTARVTPRGYRPRT